MSSSYLRNSWDTRLDSDTMSDITSVPQVDFVPATAEHYEEVMSISGGLFSGTDCLPYRYHSWLKETNRRMFVAKCEGKVVGFESFVVVDDGTAAVMEDVRVAPWIRRRGAVIPVLLPADQMETTFRLLESRVNNSDRSKNLSLLGPEEILRFFEESNTREELLPGGLLVQSWLPLTTHKSNLNLLLKQQIVWMYSHPGDSGDSASSSKVKTCDGTHAYLEGFLSLGTPPYPVPIAEGAHRLDIDLFGNDPSCAKVHVLEQLKIGVQALPAGSCVIFVLYADKSLQSELSQLCEGLTPFHYVKEQMIFETEI